MRIEYVVLLVYVLLLGLLMVWCVDGRVRVVIGDEEYKIMNSYEARTLSYADCNELSIAAYNMGKYVAIEACMIALESGLCFDRSQCLPAIDSIAANIKEDRGISPVLKIMK